MVQCGSARRVHNASDNAAQKDVTGEARCSSRGNFLSQIDDLRLITFFCKCNADVVRSLYLDRARSDAGCLWFAWPRDRCDLSGPIGDWLRWPVGSSPTALRD